MHSDPLPPGDLPLPDSSVKRRFPRLKRLFKLLIGLYVILIIVFYFLQTKMIFPGADTQGRADSIVAETASTKLLRLKLSDGTPIVARFDLATSVDPTTAPTVLLFYGNGQCAETTGGVIYIFQQLGCNVLTPDYPGYGMSGGSPSESSLYQCADICWQYLQSRNDINRNQLHIAGWSLGTGVAIDLAARVQPKSLITISAYTSMVAMGRKQMPILPISLILEYRFDSLSKIAAIKCPILMIHGLQDTLIPPEMTRELATKAIAPTTTLFLANSDHNDIFDLEQDQLIPALAKHLTR